MATHGAVASAAAIEMSLSTESQPGGNAEGCTTETSREERMAPWTASIPSNLCSAHA